MSYFNLRVYGIIINDKNEILLSDERQSGVDFTKFPGGGLEFGEGLIDALKREFREECNIEIEVIKHLYTTDFYEKSSFNESQIISVYYIVKPIGQLHLPFKNARYDFDEEQNQCFRWVKLTEIKDSDLTFRTEKAALKLLKA